MIRSADVIRPRSACLPTFLSARPILLTATSVGEPRLNGACSSAGDFYQSRANLSRSLDSPNLPPAEDAREYDQYQNNNYPSHGTILTRLSALRQAFLQGLSCRLLGSGCCEVTQEHDLIKPRAPVSGSKAGVRARTGAEFDRSGSRVGVHWDSTRRWGQEAAFCGTTPF